MNKLSYFLSLFGVLFFCNANARISKHNPDQNSVSSTATNAAKITISSERLVAYSHYDFDPADTASGPLGLRDSANLVYHSSRGSHFYLNRMNYFSLHIDFEDNGNYPVFNYLAHYDVNEEGTFYCGAGFRPGYFNSLSDAAFDTGYFYTNRKRYYVGHPEPDTTWGPYKTLVYKYDSDNNVLDAIYILGSGRTDCANVYGPGNNLLKNTQMLISNTGIIDTYVVETYFYNDLQQLIKDSVNIIDEMTNLTRYFYDSLGRESRINNSDSFYYNPDNTLRCDSGAGGQIAYTYASPFVGYARTRLFEAFGSTENSISFTSTHVNSDGLIDTMTWFSYYEVPGVSGYENVTGTKSVFIYDDANNPVTNFIYNYTKGNTNLNGAFEHTSAHVYHYYYSPVLVVNNVQQVAASFKIFPNPATNQVSITRIQVSPGIQSDICLINTNGQIVKQTSCSWQSSSQTISLSGLPSGIYWLKVQDRGSSNVFTEKIIKQ